MARHGPNRAHVKQRHTHADQHGKELHTLRSGYSFRNSQANERIEAKRHLCTAGMVTPVDPAFENGDVGQRIGQRNANESQSPARSHQSRRGPYIQRRTDDGLKQQHREQEEVHQRIYLLPDRAVQCGVAADQVAAQDEGKVGEEQLGVIHRSRIPARHLRFFPA